MLHVLVLWMGLLVGGVFASESPPTGCLISPTGLECKTIQTEDGQTVQLVRKLVPHETVSRLYQPAIENTTWICAKPACLSSPCQYGGNCTEIDQGFECECEPGFGGQRCEVYPARNCAELKERDGITEDGMYVVDPDGKRSLSDPVEVECLMENGITNVPHDIVAEEHTPTTTAVAGFERNVTYPLDSNTILALIQNSKSCQQYIKIRSYNSYIFSSDGLTQNVWWVSRQGRRMRNFGDTPSDHKGCACSYITPTHTYNTCPAGYLCNSDYISGTWREDTGYLTDLNRLPVIRLRTGYTPYNRYLYYTLGPLTCTGYWNARTDSHLTV